MASQLVVIFIEKVDFFLQSTSADEYIIGKTFFSNSNLFVLHKQVVMPDICRNLNFSGVHITREPPGDIQSVVFFLQCSALSAFSQLSWTYSSFFCPLHKLFHEI